MVAIVIVNYNGSIDTLACVESLLLSTYKQYRIIIIDNASTIDSISLLKSGLNKYRLFSQEPNTYYYLNGKVILLTSSFNGGFAVANNIGAKYAINNINELDSIWFLNNDTIVKPNTLKLLVDYLNCSSPKLGILGNKLLFVDNPMKIQAVGGTYNKVLARCKHIGAYEIDRGQYENKKMNLDYVVGASMFVRKSFITDVGFMSEDYFLYFEELDWILRGERQGWYFDCVLDAIVFHKEGGSTKMFQNQISEIADICQLRNRILFTKKFFPFFLISVLPACLMTIIFRFIKGDIVRSKILFKEYIKSITNLFYKNG